MFVLALSRSLKEKYIYSLFLYLKVLKVSKFLCYASVDDQKHPVDQTSTAFQKEEASGGSDIHSFSNIPYISRDCVISVELYYFLSEKSSYSVIEVTVSYPKAILLGCVHMLPILQYRHMTMMLMYI